MTKTVRGYPSPAGGLTLPATLEQETSTTNAITDMLTFELSCDGTVARSFGGAILFRLENAAGDMEDAMRLSTYWTSEVDGAERSHFGVGLRTSGLALPTTSGGTENEDLSIDTINLSGGQCFISTEHAQMYLRTNRTSQCIKLQAGTGELRTTAATAALAWDNARNVVLGAGTLATDATDGFMYWPTVAGVSTGAPTAKSGYVAAVYDITNNKISVNNGGWVHTAALT